MVKWFLGLLLTVAMILGALWVALYQPQREALVAAQNEQTRLQTELQRSSHNVQELESRVADLEAVREQLQEASAELRATVEAKEQELAGLRTTQDELMGELREEIAQQQVRVKRYRDQLQVDLVDEILFDSGEAELKPGGQVVLRKVGAVLKKANRRIEIQGHTDNVPIRGALAHKYPTNWELSSARAVNVARFLQDEAQIDPTQLSAAGLSEYHPRNSNDTEQGRRSNRRIEILLLPQPPGNDAPGKPATPKQ